MNYGTDFSSRLTYRLKLLTMEGVKADLTAIIIS
jgi:hypothetical protein|tara:strand:+ start:39646 stop:39747 length:102 start_codon:yes stop_codon:yes gene_type:complete